MTATPTRPRVPAGDPDGHGGRFASAECPRVYAMLDALAEHAPPPVPTARTPVVEAEPGHFRVWAPRCPHGHFARWADALDPETKTMRNCRACHPRPITS